MSLKSVAVSFAVSCFFVVVPACDGALPTGEGEGELEQGFTQCGDEVCQPGQYCEQAQTGFCVNGCTSDNNCEEGHSCQDISDVTGEGTCSEEEEPSEGEGEGERNAEQACLDACDRFSECGMTAQDKNSCLNDCPDLSENQQLAVASCAEGSCDDTLSCLAIDCFNDDDCGIDEQCVGNSCL